MSFALVLLAVLILLAALYLGKAYWGWVLAGMALLGAWSHHGVSSVLAVQMGSTWRHFGSYAM